MTLKTDMTLGTIFRRWTILVTFVVGSSLFPVTTGLGFSPGLEYWYSLEATTFIKDAGILVTSAKVSACDVTNQLYFFSPRGESLINSTTTVNYFIKK